MFVWGVLVGHPYRMRCVRQKCVQADDQQQIVVWATCRTMLISINAGDCILF